MRLTALSSDACDDSNGFLCLGRDVAIEAPAAAATDGLSLLGSLEAILGRISPPRHPMLIDNIFVTYE